MIQERKESIIDSGAMIKRFEEQQNSVRNNREFESLNKEIEYQSLEIQLSEKRIKEAEAQLEQKGEILTEVKTKHDHRAEDLKAKQSELDEIIAETRAEEEILSKMSGKMSGKIDDRLLQACLPPRWRQERHGRGADRARGQCRQLHQDSAAAHPRRRCASASSWTSTAAASSWTRNWPSRSRKRLRSSSPRS